MKAIERLCICIQGIFFLIVLRHIFWWSIGLAGLGTLTASDWAAWVQAVGSIIAILASVLLVQYQDARARQRDQDAKRSVQLQMIGAAIQCGAKMEELILSVKIVCNGQIIVSTNFIRLIHEQLIQTLRRIQEIRVGEMTRVEADDVIRLQHLCTNLMTSTVPLVDSLPVQANNFESLFSNSESFVKNCLLNLQQRYQLAAGVRYAET